MQTQSRIRGSTGFCPKQSPLSKWDFYIPEHLHLIPIFSQVGNVRQEKRPALHRQTRGTDFNGGFKKPCGERQILYHPLWGSPVCLMLPTVLSLSLLKWFRFGNKQLPSRPVPFADSQTQKELTSPLRLMAWPRGCIRSHPINPIIEEDPLASCGFLR